MTTSQVSGELQQEMSEIRKDLRNITEKFGESVGLTPNLSLMLRKPTDAKGDTRKFAHAMGQNC